MKHTAEGIRNLQRTFADILAEMYPGTHWSPVRPGEAAALKRKAATKAKGE